MPKISIIIPVYNAALFLKECLNSVLSQSFRDFELLLVDDGSKDDSAQICDEYASKDNRIRVIHQKNQGVSVARNIALDNAIGEWITFVDADDIFLPEALYRLYKAAMSNVVDVVLGGSNVLLNDNQYPYHLYESIISDKVIDNMNHPALWGYLFKTSVIKENRIRFIPGLAYSEDAVFLAAIAIKAKRIIHISECLYIYRRNEFSACTTADGLTMSRHEFNAAYAMKLLSDKEKDKQKKSFLIKKQKKLISCGCYEFAASSFTFANYAKFEEQYLCYFNDKYFLFCKTMLAKVVLLRRKLITFKDSPLSGEKGLLTTINNCLINIKKIWH